MATEKTARPFAGHWRALRILSILSIIGGIFEILLGLTGFIGFGFMQTTASPEELAEILSVSEHSAAVFVYMGFGLILFDGVLSLIRGINGIRSFKNHLALKSYTVISQIMAALEAVRAVWTLSQGSMMEVSTLTSYIFSFFMQTLYVYLGMKLMRVTQITQEEAQIAEARRLIKERRKLGFIRLLQFSYALNIILSFTMLTFITRDEVVYSYTTVVDWINLTFHVVCFYLIWKRLRIARNAIIILSAINMVLNVINYFFFSHTELLVLIFQLLVDVLVILYFIFSKRPKEALVNELSYERRTDVEGGDFIAKKGWPKWRNLIMYYCIFSVLGHWMELGFCMLIRAGVVAGEYDPSNTMLWRDLLFPFAMEGIAVVICALWLYPLKNWLVSKINVRFVPLFLSFVINGAVCTLMELVGGLLVNADHSLWDYSDMFCNFMGQICLQNAVGFGLACTLIVWIVYPAMERAIARIPSDVMNVAFVGCLAFNLILQVLYLVEPAEIANAFTIWGQVLSGNATATFIALPLLGQLRF